MDEEYIRKHTHYIDELLVSQQMFYDYIKDNDYNDNMFNDDGTININYNNYKKSGIIAEILEDHWDEFYIQHKDDVDNYRPNAPIEVQKVIDCHNKNLGFSVYECEQCHELTIVGHTCKSRLCSSCGYKYKNERVESLMETAYNCKHRQIVFTMPNELWPYFFFEYEIMINILFDAVNMTIYSILNVTYKKTKNGWKEYPNPVKYTPGFFAFLHTYGRNVKWNPHIHILIAEIAMGGIMGYKNWNFFDYDALSKRFMYYLLSLMSEHYGPSFNSVMNKMYLKYKNGFYVRAEPNKFSNLQAGIEYMARYCGKPVISENRIVNYDGENVTYCYDDHKDHQHHEVTCTATEFIGMLIRHLPPKNFKTIRYYGFYRQKDKNNDRIDMLIPKESHPIRRQLIKFANSISRSFKRNPLECPKCKNKMEFVFRVMPNLRLEGG